MMVKGDPDLKEYLFNMGFITKMELELGNEELEDCDSDLESEVDRKNMERDERIERIKLGIEHNDAEKFAPKTGLEEPPVKLVD